MSQPEQLSMTLKQTLMDGLIHKSEGKVCCQTPMNPWIYKGTLKDLQPCVKCQSSDSQNQSRDWGGTPSTGPRINGPFSGRCE